MRYGLLSLVVLVGCGGLDPVSPGQQQQAAVQGPKAWTLMVYGAADNNLDPFFDVDLGEMMVGLAPGASVNVVVLADRAGGSDSLLEVTPFGPKTLQTYAELDSGAQDTLTSFIVTAVKAYPSAHYFLDLWDHGGGFRGCCWDDSSGAHLTPSQIAAAIASAQATTGRRIEVVGFDACLMGMAEVAHELRSVTDLLVGSELTIEDAGWPYDTILAYLSKNPGVTPTALAAKVADLFVASYGKKGTPQQLGVIATSKVPALGKSLSALCDALRVDPQGNANLVNGARASSTVNHIYGTNSSFYASDLQVFTGAIRAKATDPAIVTLADDLLLKLDAAVTYEAHDPRLSNSGKLNGVSAYFPPNRNQYRDIYPGSVPAFVSETTWFPFIEAFLQ
jgi:hypothetical protein